MHVGDEDCLYLDITVPGGTQSQTKRPVMLWIHGGSYRTGSGSHYIGAPLALHGDVIIVTINYRLGMLGFLSEGPGEPSNYFFSVSPFIHLCAHAVLFVTL
mgnify:CR=1 FL=1